MQGQLTNRMNTNYYEQQLRKSEKMSRYSFEKEADFYRNLLIVASGSLGILVSLHNTQSEHLYIRMVFLLAVLLLAVGILTTAIVLHDLSSLPERARQAFLAESKAALKDDRRLKPVFVDKKKRTKVCKKIVPSALAASLILLVLYVFLTSF